MRYTLTTILAATLALSATAFGADRDAVLEEMAALKAELNQLEANQNESWLTERRAQEVKTLVGQVLADAETRSSLMDSSATLGWNGNEFFIASEDGKFLFIPQFHFQLRYIHNSRDGTAGSGVDDEESGFQARRVKFGAKGHVWDPSFKYDFRWALVGHNFDSSVDAIPGAGVGDIILDKASVIYEFDNGFWIDMQALGYGAFLREQRVDAMHQVAVERSLVNAVFSTGKVQGLLLGWSNEMFRAEVMINDGFQNHVDDFALTGSRDGDVLIGISARGEVLLAGTWDQFKDYNSWTQDELGILLGGAIHYQRMDGSGHLEDAADLLLLTIDGSVEYKGAALTAYFVFMDIDTDDPTPGHDPDASAYAVVVQGSYNVNDKFEPFMRWERMWRSNDFDGLQLSGTTSGRTENILFDTGDEINILTLGFNWFLSGHNSKLTFDLMAVLHGTGDSVFGAGVVGTDQSNDDKQLVFRAQYQLAF